MIVDSTLISAPGSTINRKGEREPERHQPRKGNQWYYRMKAHPGFDQKSALIHAAVNTAAKVHDLSASAGLLHGEENIVYGGSGYQGIDKRPETNNKASTFRVGRRPVGHGLRMDRPEERLDNLIKMARAIIRARVEHPFKIMKQ